MQSSMNRIKKDIAEAEEDIRQGRIYTTKELREKPGDQMSYSLYWTERASKDLEKLPRLISHTDNK